MRKRLLSLVLALVLALSLLPAAARAAETTVSLSAGGHYRVVNTTNDDAYIELSGAGESRYDYAIYKANGMEGGFDQNVARSDYWTHGMEAGGSMVLSVYGALDLAVPEGVTVSPSAAPALATFTLEANKNYKLTNRDSQEAYGIRNTSSNGAGVFYDQVMYYPDGKIVSNGLASILRDTTGDFFVLENAWNSITIHDTPISGYIPYAQKDLLTFTEVAEPALVTYTLRAGQSYTVVNNDPTDAHGLETNADGGGSFDFAFYMANGKLIDNGMAPTGEDATGGIFVDTGGRTEVTINKEDLHCYLPYTQRDILTVRYSDGSVMPYTANETGGGSKLEYIYDVPDPAASLILPVRELEKVTNMTTAASAVRTLTGQMTRDQKSSAVGVDLATLYAETATAKAARKAVNTNEVIINAAAVADLEKIAKETSGAVETALVNGGVSTARYLANTVTLTTNATGEISIKIDPDILTTEVDKIRVETPTYALTLKVDELAADLTEVMTITMEDVGAGYAAGKGSGKVVVSLNLPNGKTSNPVTLSLPTDKSDTTYQTVVTTAGKSTSSKYNPATVTMDGKVNTSGSYTVQTNEKNFSDIAAKSAEMQAAIRYLASKGIINGKTSTTFDPDGSINRAEIAALLVRALGKLDNSASSNFTDVRSGDWYYAAAGSSQRCGLIKGYNDKTFRGLNTISKVEIVAVASRVLTTEMGYTAAGNAADYLGKYSDTVVSWAQKEVALATRENLIVYRTDGTFSGTKNMTRGDAAIIIYRLFQRIW